MAKKPLCCPDCYQLQLPFVKTLLPCLACAAPPPAPPAPEDKNIGQEDLSGWHKCKGDIYHQLLPDGNRLCDIYGQSVQDPFDEVGELPPGVKSCPDCYQLITYGYLEEEDDEEEEQEDIEGWAWFDENHRNRYHYFLNGVTLCSADSIILSILEPEGYDELVTVLPRGAKKCKLCKHRHATGWKPGDKPDEKEPTGPTVDSNWSILSFTT